MFIGTGKSLSLFWGRVSIFCIRNSLLYVNIKMGKTVYTQRRVLCIVCSFSSIGTLFIFPSSRCGRKSASYTSQTSRSWIWLVPPLRGTSGILEGEREKPFFLYLLVESKAMAVTVAEAAGAVRGRVAAPAKCQLCLGSAGQLASHQAAWCSSNSLSGTVTVGSG